MRYQDPDNVDARFRQTVQKTIAGLPPPLALASADVVVLIHEFADRDTLRDLGIDDPFDLLGLYQGVSLDRRSIDDVARPPDMVFLYRRPIVAYAHATGETLEDVVRHVTIHEIGHHFGFSDEAMEAIERDRDL